MHQRYYAGTVDLDRVHIRAAVRTAFRDGQHMREPGTRLRSLFGQSREALLSKVGDQIKFASFKQVPGVMCSERRTPRCSAAPTITS